jgi:hypothetical protein
MSTNHEDIFSTVYENRIWGDNGNDAYKGSSGEGSLMFHNENTWIPFFRNLVTMNSNIRKIVDLGCGDFQCGNAQFDGLPVEYVGYDAYDKVVLHNQETFPGYRFHHLDFFHKREEIESADLCILKDVLIHWNCENIDSFLSYLIRSKKFKWILLCNCSQQIEDNHDIKTGDYRPITANMNPLKKFNPVIIYTFISNVPKEVCIITVE